MYGHFRGDGASHVVQAGFCRIVSNIVGIRHFSVYARDKDDFSAPATFDHVLGDQLTHVKAAGQGALEYSFKIRCIVLEIGCLNIGSRVAHKDVDLRSRRQCLLDKHLALTLNEGIGRDRCALTPPSHNLVAGTLQVWAFMVIVNDQVSTAIGQCQRTTLSNPVAGSGD